jgi:transcriptional regulator with XRE-family HTH domain
MVTASDQMQRSAVCAVIVASRHEANLTQEQLADATGWHRTRLAKIEACERRVEFHEIFAIARGLGVNPVLLMIRIQLWVSAPTVAESYHAVVKESYASAPETAVTAGDAEKDRAHPLAASGSPAIGWRAFAQMPVLSDAESDPVGISCRDACVSYRVCDSGF